MSTIDTMSPADKLAFAGYDTDTIRAGFANWANGYDDDFDLDAIVAECQEIVAAEFDARFTADYGPDADLEDIRARGQEPEGEWIIDEQRWSQICERHERTIIAPTVAQVWQVAARMASGEVRMPKFGATDQRLALEAAFDIGVLEPSHRFSEEVYDWLVAAKDSYPEADTYRRAELITEHPEAEGTVGLWKVVKLTDPDYVIESGVITEDAETVQQARDDLEDMLGSHGWEVDGAIYWDTNGDGAAIVVESDPEE